MTFCLLAKNVQYCHKLHRRYIFSHSLTNKTDRKKGCGVGSWQSLPPRSNSYLRSMPKEFGDRCLFVCLCPLIHKNLFSEKSAFPVHSFICINPMIKLIYTFSVGRNFCLLMKYKISFLYFQLTLNFTLASISMVTSHYVKGRTPLIPPKT